MTWRLGRWTYVVITIFLSTETVAVGWNVHNYPDSPENVELCGRNVSSEHVSHVCDPDGVITPLEGKVRCDNGTTENSAVGAAVHE